MSNMPPPPPPPPPGPGSPPPPPSQGSYGSSGTTGWAITGTGQQLQLASAGARLGARIIDFVIMGVVAVVLIIIGLLALFGVSSEDTLTDDEESTIGFAFLFGTWAVIALIGLLYEVVMIATRGQTLGKMMTSVKVVRADNGLAPGWGKSIGRWIIPLVLGFIPAVGPFLSLLVYLSLLWDSARQGWHDKAAGTFVIKV